MQGGSFWSPCLQHIIPEGTHTHTHGIMETDKPQDLQSELVVGKLEPWRTDSVDSISKVIMKVPVFQVQRQEKP